MKIAMTPKPKARVMLSEPDYRTLLALLDGERIGAGTRRYTQWADRMFRVFRNRPILINSDPASLAALRAKMAKRIRREGGTNEQ